MAIFFVNGFYCIGWTPLWSYPSEILTYETRARGVTLQTGLLHITGFFVTFVNPIGLDNAGWKYYIAYVVYTFLEVSDIPMQVDPTLTNTTSIVASGLVLLC